MSNLLLKVHPNDNVVVALKTFKEGEYVDWQGERIQLKEDIEIKHKFAEIDIAEGDIIYMYGVVVGKAVQSIAKGARISIDNVVHESAKYQNEGRSFDWNEPDIGRFEGRTFMGYHRADGKVGTRNYWLVIPLVFCENRNVKLVQKLMVEKLGYSLGRKELNVDELINLYESGGNIDTILNADLNSRQIKPKAKRVFPNIDGIKFLVHEGGCGGTRQDAETLCRLFAGYINNPNVAGATIMSLGCQNAEFAFLEKALNEFSPDFKKTTYLLVQQESESEEKFIEDAVKKTFVGLMEANRIDRQEAPLSKLILGLECGGSDGFSGLSANPALGHSSDLLVALGGSTVLSEFPELNGVEQEIINRCTTDQLADKFSDIMGGYSRRANEVGSGFEMNPSPGNIKDGLITDAIKSAGAAKKGGTSPITDVLDYTEQVTKPGLNLLCTPGNDVESTTGLAGSGANLIVFTTGLGTPTGNAIAPTVKFSTNNELAKRMTDIIDINAGTIITGEDTIATKGEELLEFLIKVASGEVLTKAEILGQDDFIPWKRGVSL